jgi:hypothetical protein
MSRTPSFRHDIPIECLSLRPHRSTQSQLAVKALWKQGQEAGVPAFISAASERLPSMASDFGHLAERVEAQLTGGAWCEGGASADGLREEMLASHRWLSCIDLQAVDGRHHKSSPGLLSMDAF